MKLAEGAAGGGQVTLRRSYKGFASAYATLTVVLTALLFVLGARAAERTGLHRHVYPAVGFRGIPLTR